MASSIKPLVRTYKTSGVVPAYSFVKFDSASAGKNPTVVVCESAKAIGISQNQASTALGAEIEVAFPGGGALLTLGGTVGLGGSIKATTAGVGIATTGAGDYIGAYAVEAGVVGDIIGVHVTIGQKYSADGA